MVYVQVYLKVVKEYLEQRVNDFSLNTKVMTVYLVLYKETLRFLISVLSALDRKSFYKDSSD